MIYNKPVIFELGNVAELTAGGNSKACEQIETTCYDRDGNIISHIFDQPKN